MHMVMNHLNIIHSALPLVSYGHQLAFPVLEQYREAECKEILRLRALWIANVGKCPQSDCPTHMKHQRQTVDLQEQVQDLYGKTLTSVKNELEAFVSGIDVPPKYLQLKTPRAF